MNIDDFLNENNIDLDDMEEGNSNTNGSQQQQQQQMSQGNVEMVN